MYTAKNLKEKLIDHLMSMDLGRLEIQGLAQYVCIVKTVDDMEKPGYAEALGMAMAAHNGMSDKKGAD